MACLLLGYRALQPYGGPGVLLVYVTHSRQLGTAGLPITCGKTDTFFAFLPGKRDIGQILCIASND
ncbi:MAG: hypothetical protein RSH52_30255, partial [Janthinobacterium sp.]